MAEEKLFLEDEIAAVEAQFNAFCKELNTAYGANLPSQVTGALQSLGTSIRQLRKARDGKYPLGGSIRLG